MSSPSIENTPEAGASSARGDRRWRGPAIVGLGSAVLTAATFLTAYLVAARCHSDAEWGCLGVLLLGMACAAVAVLIGQLVLMRLARVPLWGLAALTAFWFEIGILAFRPGSVLTPLWQVVDVGIERTMRWGGPVSEFTVLAAVVSALVAAVFRWHRVARRGLLVLVVLDIAQAAWQYFSLGRIFHGTL
jgi:hypothetical protein